MTQAKRTPTIKNKSSKYVPKHQALKPAAARVHDLSGIVCLGLSAELRTIFDEEAIQEIVSDLESRVMTVIIRRPGDIAYLDLQVVVTRELGDPKSKASKQPKSPTRQPRSKA